MVFWVRSASRLIVVACSCASFYFLYQTSQASSNCSDHRRQPALLWSALGRSNVDSIDIPLESLTQRALRSGEMINVRMPYDRYWIARLRPTSGFEMIVPIYKSFRDTNRAWLYAPTAGTYDLSIHLPILGHDEVPTDPDPSICMPYGWFPPDNSPDLWYRSLNKVPRPLHHMQDFCARWKREDGQIRPNDDFIRFGGAFPPPRVSNLSASLVYQTQLQFKPAQGRSERMSLEAELNGAAEKIYGLPASLLQPSPAEMLGYWYKDDVVTTEPGSLSFQPQPETCEWSFNDLQNAHQDTCLDQGTTPTYRFTSFSLPRRKWLMTPNAMSRCIDQMSALRLYGDSKMWESWRSLQCLNQGYGGLYHWTFAGKFSPHMLLLDPMLFFAPRDAYLELNETEKNGLLGLDPEPPTGSIEIWQIGMWPVSYAATAEFPRGLHRIFSHVSKRRDDHQTKPFIVLVTSPTSEPSGKTYGPWWQTSERAYLFNRALTEVAAFYKIPIIDNFWPTIFRFDARTDNCHFC